MSVVEGIKEKGPVSGVKEAEPLRQRKKVRTMPIRIIIYIFNNAR